MQVINTQTGKVVFVPLQTPTTVSVVDFVVDLKFDPSTGTLYGIGYDGNSFHHTSILAFDLGAGSVRSIASLDSFFLNQIPPNTAFDPTTHRYFLAGSNNSAGITHLALIVDTTTGSVSYVPAPPGLIAPPGVLQEFSFDQAGDLLLNITREAQGDGMSWAGLPYDTYPGKTIANKGCALTSLTMALNYMQSQFNLPTPHYTDPGRLNNLMTAMGGYAGHFVNWFNATTLEANAAQVTLWYDSRNSGIEDQAGLSVLDSSLNEGLPRIVGVTGSDGSYPGHFVLVTGRIAGRYVIADPGPNNYQYLDQYQNTTHWFQTRGVVRGVAPSQAPGGPARAPASVTGDISALSLSVDRSADILLIDSAGRRQGFDPRTSKTYQEIPQASYFTDAISDDLSGEAPEGGLHAVQGFQPAQGTYQVLLFGHGVGTVTLIMDALSQDGMAQPRVSSQVITDQASVTTFQLQFASTPGSQSSLIRGGGTGGGSLPACTLQLNQSSFVNGDAVTVTTLRVANPTTSPVPVEWKLWLTVPTIPPIAILNIGANGAVQLPAGFNQNFGPIPFFTVSSGLPRGSYQFGCRLFNPVTFELFTETLTPFTIQ